jgi:hypothetical protein
MTPKELLENKKNLTQTLFLLFLESNSEIETSSGSPIADEEKK